MLPSATDLFYLSRYRVVRSRLQRRRNVNLDSFVARHRDDAARVDVIA